MPESNTRRDFEEAAASWVVFGGRGGDVILLACDLLVDGADTPALRDLAGMPLDSSRADGIDVLRAAFGELGMPQPNEHSDLTKTLALRNNCRLIINGTVPAGPFLEAIGGSFGLDLPDAVDPLLRLAYESDFSARNRPITEHLRDAMLAYLDLPLAEAIRRTPPAPTLKRTGILSMIARLLRH